MSGLCESAKRTIAATLAETPHGERCAVVQRLAAMYGVSATTIYRIASVGGTSRPKSKRTDYRDWVRAATVISHRAPDKPIPLDLAIDAGITSGELPPEAADMPLRTAYRIRRELGLHRTNARTQRLSADYPMQAVQFDGSSSMYLSVVRQLDDGDWLLKLYRRPISARGYKNKPLGPNRERPITYGLWDMCTGYRLSTYVIARGEDALDSAESLVWMLGEKEDNRLVMHGIPDDLWLDQGPVTKSKVTADLLDRLNIHLVTGEPYDKTRMGGVERAWRTLWMRFERSLFLLDTNEITLSALNARLVEYLVRENGLRNARVRVGNNRISRTDAWVALTNARPADNQLRRLPDNPLATLAAEKRCRLNRNGHLHWGGQEYEAPTLFDCWVIARRAPDGSGDVVIEHEETKTREVARPVQQRPYGEIRATKKLPLARLLDEQTAEFSGADVYALQGDTLPTNVLKIPARITEPAPLDNPLDVGSFSSLDEAMQYFYSLYPYPVSEAHDRSIRQIITERKLNQQAVIDMAQEMTVFTATGDPL